MRSGDGIFPNERPGKTQARLVVYDAFVRALGLDEFRKAKHLVLGGHGGDVRLLRRLYVPLSSIWVVDRKANCIDFLARQYSGCHFFEAELADAAAHLARERIDFGTLNIDLCSNLYESVVSLVEGTLKQLLSPRSCFSVTVRADRERELPMYIAAEQAKLQVPQPYNEHSNSLARSVALCSLLSERMAFEPWGFYAYKSDGLDLKEKPRCTNMAILLGSGLQARNPWRGKNQFRTTEQPVQRPHLNLKGTT